jgi:hypothetical protein
MRYRSVPHVVGIAAAGVASMVVSPAFAVDPAFSIQTNAAGLAATHSTSGFNNANYAGGGAVGDFNNDGWQDVYFLSGGSGTVSDKLFINNGDGTFTDHAAEWGLTGAHRGKGATVADFNNDGWLDLYVTSAGPVPGSVGPGHHKLYRNNGDGTFTNIASSAGVNATNPGTQDGWGACFGDYDLDGDLDLIVGGSTQNNAGNKLFRNNGDETFTDVTAQIGLFTGVPGIWGFTPALVDTNDDRYPDLMFVGDFGTSRYFKNDADGTFTEFTAGAHAGQEENGMGQTYGDFDNDGRIDFYVTSIYFPASGWTGNKLYRNLSNAGSHSFLEYGATAGVDDGGYGWGALAVDFNHDGWVDIAETNGGSCPGTFCNEQSYLWVNNANNTFTEMAPEVGMIHNGMGRSMINFDADNDGDQDVLIFANNQALTYFRNDLPAGPDTNWLRVFVDNGGDPAVPANGYNALVRAVIGGTTYTRAIGGGNTYLGINELSAHFGLGTVTAVDEVRVEWHDGQVTSVFDVAVNQTITVVRGGKQPCAADLGGDGEVGASDLGDLLAQWGPCKGKCTADIAPPESGDGTVGAGDLAEMLANWGQCP